MSNGKLFVYLNNAKVGELFKDDLGGFNFCYSENVKNPLSLSLPISKKEFLHKECKGFFNGLLPESENVRIAIGKKYGINPKNDFSILKAIGYDCAGAVAFFDKEQKDLKEYYDIEGNILSDDELEKYINNLPKKPLALSKDKRLSLAGAQDKTAVVLIDDKIALLDNTTPTTHILKPAIKDYKETVENEYICLNVAKKLGLKVPNIEIRYSNKTKYFLIERYDREIKNKKIKRIHQEDFSQALNIPSAYKYQAEGGASFVDCFEILKQTSKPTVSIKQFIELMIFNYLIGNNDAHGKNFSILHYDNGEIVFAPCYDILCSMVYDGLTSKMAMKIGGHYEHNKILIRHFEKLANDLNISFTQLKKVIKNQCEILPDITKEVIESFDNTIGKEILDVVIKNSERLEKKLKENV